MDSPINRAKQLLKEGAADELRAVLGSFPELLQAQDEDGQTLVNFACRVVTGDISRPPVRGTPAQDAALDVLLDAGCDLAAGDQKGFAPLHVAAMASHSDLARRLLAAGAPRTGRVYGTEGGTPLSLALFYGERDVSTLLADPPEPDNLRTAAALGRELARFFEGDVPTAQASVGTDFTLGWCGRPFTPRTNSRQQLLDEALCWSARNEQVGSMMALCSRGADVNANPFRGTPLTYAAAHNQTKSICWLLDHGADPNLKHDFGGEGHGHDAVALHIAAQFGALDAIRALVEGGADLNARDANFDATPLQWAEHVGAGESVKLLKTLGAE